MSTKLPLGLRVKDSVGRDVFALSKRVKDVIEKTYVDLRMELLAEQVAAFVDEPQVRAETEDDMLLRAVQQRWVREQNEESDISTFHDPLRFSLVFAKITDQKGVETLLAYPLLHRSEYHRALLDSGLFQEYSLDTRTDQPELTRAEREQRIYDWDQALDERGSFSGWPSWYLETSVSRTIAFDLIELTRQKDINTYVTQRQRLVKSLVSTVSQRLTDWDEAVKTQSLGDLLRAVSEAERIVRLWVEDKPDDTLSLPDPLPRDLMLSVSDLPEPFVPAEEHIQEILAIPHDTE